MKEKEIIYYLEAANGMTVRVPQSKLESWKKRQYEIRAEMEAGRTPQPDPQRVNELLSLLEKR